MPLQVTLGPTDYFSLDGYQVCCLFNEVGGGGGEFTFLENIYMKFTFLDMDTARCH